MGSARNTRKPVNLLTAEDFAAFPIWEYASDEEGVPGQDETWVRPVDSHAVPKYAYLHVAAQFTAANGRQLSGCVTVSTLNGPPEACQGAVFHGGVGLFVSNPKAICFRQSRDELLTALGLAETDLFPLSFRLQVPIDG